MDQEELIARQGEVFGTLMVSTAQITLAMADRILRLAKEHCKDQDTPDTKNPHDSDSTILAGCAIIMFATALEQGIGSILTNEAWRIHWEEGVDFWHTPHAKLDEDSLRKRIEDLPSLLTKGLFCLSPASHLTHKLVKLIQLRNKLIHVNERAKQVTAQRGEIRVVDGGLEVCVPLTNPWLDVTLQDAESFQESVSAYFDEVLYPKSGKIEAGKIVVPAA